MTDSLSPKENCPYQLSASRELDESEQTKVVCSLGPYDFGDVDLQAIPFFAPTREGGYL